MGQISRVDRVKQVVRHMFVLIALIVLKSYGSSRTSGLTCFAVFPGENAGSNKSEAHDWLES